MFSVTNSILTLLTCLSLIFLSVYALFDIIDMHGYNIKLFHYSQNKKKKEYQRIEKIIDEYVNKNNELLISNSKAIANVVLQGMGLKDISEEQLIEKISDLRKSKRKINSMEDVNRALKDLLLLDGVIVDLEKTVPERKTIYPTLKYYINLTDNIGNFLVQNSVVTIMHFYIESELKKMKKGLKDIDKIIIPTESNTVMGISLARQLNKEAVIMLSRARRIYEAQYWDGDLKNGDRAIIIHDVIYSGDGIMDCIEHIYEKCSILGVFAVFNRKESKKNENIGKEEIERTGIKVFSAFEIDDVTIGKWLEEE